MNFIFCFCKKIFKFGNIRHFWQKLRNSKININKISHLTNILYFLQGVIFSLNARNSRQEHISLELKEGRLELVHSLPNGSNIIDIPAKISDGKWHQLAIR